MGLDASLLSRTISGRLVGNCRVDAVPSAAEVESDGARLVAASSVDLLGLGTDARVREALTGALRKHGLGQAPSSRVQERVEGRLASLLGFEAALAVDSAERLLAALPTWRLAVDAHGARHLDGATAVQTPEEADVVLERPALAGLVVDAVRPLSGELAPLPRYVESCERRHRGLVVIDAGLGVLGPSGGGACEHLGLQGLLSLAVLPLGGAIPGVGAVVLGSAGLVEALRGAVAAPPIALLEASLKGFEICAAEPARRARLFDVAQAVLTALRARGLDTGPCVTPWIPLWLGDEGSCRAWLDALAEAGVACRGWLAGPRSRLLFSLPATLTDAQVGQVLEAIERAGKKLGYPEADASHRTAPVLARPGSYAMAVPAALHWSTLDPIDRPAPSEPSPPGAPVPLPSSAEDQSLTDRVYDAVETLTWRATSTTSAQLRRSADALRALIDRRRR